MAQKENIYLEQTLTLGGKKFTALVNSTLEHDHLLMDEIRGAGLDVIEKLDTQHPEDFVRDLLAKVSASGKFFTLLAFMLVPAGTAAADWTPEIAAATELHIRQLTDPADKQAVNDHLVYLLMGFFQAGLISLKTIQSYSVPADPAPASEPAV